MNVDDLRALEIAVSAVEPGTAPQATRYWLDFEDGYWEVGSAYEERVVWIDANIGQSVSNFLSPVRALAAAKLYAQANSLGWKPSFTLQLKRDCWIVGSCQSQFGGQTYVHVSHDGNVNRHWVNPK
jgi:hypothetical protein